MDAQTATVKYDPAIFKPVADTESLEGRFGYTVEEDESPDDDEDSSEEEGDEASSSDDEGSSKKVTKLP